MAVAIARACAARASSGASVTSPARLASSWSRVGCAAAQCGRPSPAAWRGSSGRAPVRTRPTVPGPARRPCAHPMPSLAAGGGEQGQPCEHRPHGTQGQPQRQGAAPRSIRGSGCRGGLGRGRTRRVGRGGAGRRWAVTWRLRGGIGRRGGLGRRGVWTRVGVADSVGVGDSAGFVDVGGRADSRAGWRWPPGRASSTGSGLRRALRWWSRSVVGASVGVSVGASVGFSVGDVVGSGVTVAVGRDGLGRSLGGVSEGVGRSTDPDGRRGREGHLPTEIRSPRGLSGA